jgi:hypothetical protein
MDGQVKKKRRVFINDRMTWVSSKRITIDDLKMGKTLQNGVWYIFDLDTGKVIFQSKNWTDCLKGVKDFITSNIKRGDQN